MCCSADDRHGHAAQCVCVCVCSWGGGWGVQRRCGWRRKEVLACVFNESASGVDRLLSLQLGTGGEKEDEGRQRKLGAGV